MRSTLLSLAAILVVSAAAPAMAQTSSHPFGIGLAFGDPSGFTAKYHLSGADAVQATLGLRGSYYHGGWYSWHNGPQLSVDYTHRVASLETQAPVKINFYVGVGGALGSVAGSTCYYDTFGRQTCYSDGAPALAVRVPLGAAAYFTRAQIEVYVELAPALLVLPGLGQATMGALGGRFYF